MQANGYGPYLQHVAHIFEHPAFTIVSYFCISKKNTDMILERTKNEILVRLPANVDLTELQNLLDYLEYKEATSGTKAKQKEVDELSETVNKSIWNKIKSQRDIK